MGQIEFLRPGKAYIFLHHLMPHRYRIIHIKFQRDLFIKYKDMVFAGSEK